MNDLFPSFPSSLTYKSTRGGQNSSMVPHRSAFWITLPGKEFWTACIVPGRLNPSKMVVPAAARRRGGGMATSCNSGGGEGGDGNKEICKS